MSSDLAEFYQEAWLLSSSGKYDEAINQLESALAISPDNSATHLNKGLVYHEAGLPVEALNSLGIAMRISPSKVSIYGAIAAVLDKHMDDLAAAKDMLRVALELEPDYSKTWNSLGVMLKNRDQLDDAVDAMRQAVSLEPSDPTYRRNFAVALRSCGKFEESYDEQLHAEKYDDGDSVLDLPALAFAPATLAVNTSDISEKVKTLPDSTKAHSNGYMATQVKLSALPEDTPLEWNTLLRSVHVTRVATVTECTWAIKAADSYAATHGWKVKGHHSSKPTKDILVAESPELRRWVQNLLLESIWPAIELQFGIDRTDLWLEDCFIVKYESAGQPGLGTHTDDSELSFNLLLSDPSTFEGGGTAFPDAEPEEVAVRPSQGEMITHYGKLRHEGKPVLGGAPRYILAGFVRARPLGKAWRQLLQLPAALSLADSGDVMSPDSRDVAGVD